MERLNEMTSPIQDSALQDLQPALQALQGNILRGHGRGRSVHIFLQFLAEPPVVKHWIHNFAKCVTSAWKQREQADQKTTSSSLFCNFLLSSLGYQYLDLNTQKFSKAFKSGMKNAKLQDPPKHTWEEGYQKDIHAMILLACSDEDILYKKVNELYHDINQIAEICSVEHGRVMRKHGKPVEHFGYVDGISQPLFFQRDVIRETAQVNTDKWNSCAGPNLVIIQDPHGGEYDFGSYMVFRKLEQNVRGFTEAIEKLASDLRQTVSQVGAQAVGRFQDGTPIVLYNSIGNPTNNFNFLDEDHYGLKCPFHAHIRKVNPHHELRASKDHRIARRGITYGKRDREPKDNPRLEDMPTKDVGLLFMCFQSDITAQFELLQTGWADNTNHLLPETGIDPIIGHMGSGGSIKQNWRPVWGRTGVKPISLPNFITLKGGEYFFAPSIEVLKIL